MADIEHSTLTGSALHEPKGVAAAVAGTVYTANGSGSGAWAALPGSAPNVVSVTSVLDLPAAVGDVHTLADDTCYTISGIIDLGSNRIVMGNNCYVIGCGANIDGFTSTTSSALFTATSSNVRLDTLNFTVSAGKVISFDGGGIAFLVLSNIIINNCDSLGTVANGTFLVFDGVSVFSANTNGVSFSGANNFLFYTGSSFQLYSGTAIDLGTATFDSVFFGPQVIIQHTVGNVGIAVASNSGNFTGTGRGVVEGNVVVGGGTNTVGLAVDDLKWNVFDNFGIPSTEVGAQGYITNSALTTTFSGTGVNTLVNFGAAFLADLEDKFTISNAGRFTYFGLEQALFYVDATIFASIAGGASRQYSYMLAKNGTVIASSVCKAEYDGANPGSNSVSSIVELEENDYLELYVVADTATTALTVDTASIKCIGVGV